MPGGRTSNPSRSTGYTGGRTLLGQRSPLKTMIHFIQIFRETEIFLYVTMIVIDSGGNLKEHIGLKHMGISSKDWRNPEFKAVRDSASSHQAWEFVPAAGDPFRYNRQT